MKKFINQKRNKIRVQITYIAKVFLQLKGNVFPECRKLTMARKLRHSMDFPIQSQRGRGLALTHSPFHPPGVLRQSHRHLDGGVPALRLLGAAGVRRRQLHRPPAQGAAALPAEATTHEGESAEPTAPSAVTFFFPPVDLIHVLLKNK